MSDAPNDTAPVDVGAVLARVERARKEISDLCHGRRKWTMSVPVQLDRDSDIVFADVTCDAVRLCAEMERLRTENAAQSRVCDAARELVAYWTDETPPAGVRILFAMRELRAALASDARDTRTGEGRGDGEGDRG